MYVDEMEYQSSRVLDLSMMQSLSALQSRWCALSCMARSILPCTRGTIAKGTSVSGLGNEGQ